MGILKRKKKTQAPVEEHTSIEVEEQCSSAQAGPFDIADAPHTERIDFGAIQVRPQDGMQISLEMEQQTRRVSGLTLALRESAVQLNAFAAPKSSGLWDDVRSMLRESIAEQGGTTEVREGSFGRELHARIPLNSTEPGPAKYRPMRFVGIDGPRWFLRAVISGAALRDEEAREEIEDAIRSLVIVRGTMPMAPKEVIELTAPQEALSDNTGGPTEADLDPAGQGPSIAVTG